MGRTTPKQPWEQISREAQGPWTALTFQRHISAHHSRVLVLSCCNANTEKPPWMLPPSCFCDEYNMLIQDIQRRSWLVYSPLHRVSKTHSSSFSPISLTSKPPFRNACWFSNEVLGSKSTHQRVFRRANEWHVAEYQHKSATPYVLIISPVNFSLTRMSLHRRPRSYNATSVKPLRMHRCYDKGWTSRQQHLI